MRSMSLRDMQIPKSEKKILGPPPPPKSWGRPCMRRCKRCRLDGHQIGDTNICPAYMKPRTELLAFVNGPLSNFDRCDVTMDSMTFITSPLQKTGLLLAQ